MIADLVVNHTSDRHPWFKSARASRTSKYRDFYVWADEPPANAQAEPTFPDQETSVWTFDEQAGQYYLHRFYKHQPDLNVANPLVRDEIAKIMGYLAAAWAVRIPGRRRAVLPGDHGHARCRVRAADPHEYLRDLRAFSNRRTGDAILLGEVNLDHKQQTGILRRRRRRRTAHAVRLHRDAAALPLLGPRRRAPLIDALTTRPQPQPESQWASFVRNHDELTLDKLSEAERQEVFAAFGPEPEMQVYGRGLIRRLPPMLGGDPRRIRMVYSLLFSLPGTPVLFYGEEIGMGENLEAGDRLAVRTPMQWSMEKNGGFSNAAPSRLSGQAAGRTVRPGVRQRRRPAARPRLAAELHPHARPVLPRLPRARLGHVEILDQPYAAVLAHRCTWDDGSIVLLHNLAADAVTVPLALSNWIEGTRLSDLLGPATLEPDARGRLEVPLDGYGYRWIRVIAPDSRRLS